MSTKLIQYHPKTAELALFETNNKFWVGSYSPNMSHQNGEPPYYFIRGYYSCKDVGIKVLNQLVGDEF